MQDSRVRMQMPSADSMQDPYFTSIHTNVFLNLLEHLFTFFYTPLPSVMIQNPKGKAISTGKIISITSQSLSFFSIN